MGFSSTNDLLKILSCPTSRSLWFLKYPTDRPSKSIFDREKLIISSQLFESVSYFSNFTDLLRHGRCAGFLQLKEPVKPISMQKSGASVAKSLPYNMIWPRKARRVNADPMHKVNEELQRDLELVYVGQVCLSWEILHWQHGKAQELQEYDSQGLHRYNQVAGDFQLFQVLLQRFIENEPFQGPRVHNYVSNRCVLRNLLQVPVIRGKRKRILYLTSSITS